MPGASDGFHAPKRLVVVGNGMAGVRTLEELLKLAPGLYDITVFGAEPHPNYNRILLSPVLAGEQTLDEIVLNSREWYAPTASRASGQEDRAHRSKRALCRSRRRHPCRLRPLLLATGSDPFILPIAGTKLEGVLTYRDIHDTQRMIEAAATHRTAVVIGGGLWARGRQRPQASRHGRDRRAPDARAHGAAGSTTASPCREDAQAKGLGSGSRRKPRRSSAIRREAMVSAFAR